MRKNFLLIVLTILCTNLFAAEISPAQAQVYREKFVAEAKKYVGCPYEYGSVGPKTFDCSGLIYYTARESTGIQLPRTAKAIYNFCRRVPDKDREPGDLLFFKTTGNGTISHVGIYIGNSQFISAISDGPNTGVIISSLKQDYWKDKYVSAGQFIGSGKGAVQEEEFEEEVVVLEDDDATGSEQASGNGKFAAGLVADAAIYCDWSLINMNQFMFKFRGIDFQTNIYYKYWPLQPGIGFNFRFNTSQGLFQLPVLFSAYATKNVRVYAGPVISFGKNAKLISTEKEIVPSFFPGILGVSLTTPELKLGGTKLQIVQDISYTVFNNMDNSALNFVESFASGFVMSTGIKFTLPLSLFVKD